MTDEMFGFMDSSQDASVQLGPNAFNVPEENENVRDFKFPRFAATHFQNNATHVYICQAIKEPLLSLKSEGDQLVSIFIQHVFVLGLSISIFPCLSKIEQI